MIVIKCPMCGSLDVKIGEVFDFECNNCDGGWNADDSEYETIGN